MFLVSRTNFDEALSILVKDKYLGLDTETTGLYPYLGDRLFSLILANATKEFYFNWKTYPGLPEDLVLGEEHMKELQRRVFRDPDKYYFIHKGIFDHPILNQDGMHLEGTVHCTINGARIQYNEYIDYSLDGLGTRIKFKKDKSVENCIKKHSLYTVKDYNGYKEKVKRYDLVPFAIMSKYGCRDGRVVYELGMYQLEKIKERAQKMAGKKANIDNLFQNELKLQRTLHGIQTRGARVDKPYCHEAVEHFNGEMRASEAEFRGLTGRDFLLSSKLFGELFESEKDKWEFTEKGNPSFKEHVLERFEHPAASQVLRYKKAKSKVDFFNGFLKHTDKDGFIHTEFKSYGTRTGRFSSAAPNLQNLEKAKGEALKEKFVVRRAFIPRDGYFFAMLDYDQIEYRMMLDYARANQLIDKVLGGLDVHTATGEVAGVSRDDAKTVNFGTVYGQGIAALARSLGTTESRAREIQNTIFDAAPEIRQLIYSVKRTAETRGNIHNWLGRMYYFPKRSMSYKAPNTLMQGGAGDVAKVAMVQVDEFLMGHQSHLLLNTHDELAFEMKYGEEHLLYEIQEIMQAVYPYWRLPLTCGIEWSDKSLADKKEFTGVDCVYGEERRNEIQGEDLSTVEESPEYVGQEDSATGPSGHSRLSDVRELGVCGD